MRAYFRNALASIFISEEGQIPALHGLRAIAILMVILQHSFTDFSVYGGIERESVPGFSFLRGMWVGVDLFFVLSGFLIGGVLVREFAGKQVCLFQFWWRRILRIWPAYFFVLFCMLVLLRLRPPEGYSEWPEILFFSNYIDSGILSGSWSIATEEQFYVFAPLVLLLLARVTGSLRAPRLLIAGLFFLSPIVRYGVWIKLGRFTWEDKALLIPNIHLPFHTHADALLVGFFLATLSRQKTGPCQRFGLLLLFSALCTFFLRRLNPVCFTYSTLALFFGAILWFAVTLPDNWPKRILSAKILYPIARLSFGMYLCHRLVSPNMAALVYGLHPTKYPLLSLVLTFLLTSLATFAAAFLLYLLVERPFLNLRRSRGRLEVLAQRATGSR